MVVYIIVFPVLLGSDTVVQTGLAKAHKPKGRAGADTGWLLKNER